MNETINIKKTKAKKNKWNIQFIEFVRYYVQLVYLYFPDKSWIGLYFQRPDFIPGYLAKKETKYTRNISNKIADNTYNNDPELKEMTIDYLKGLMENE